MNQGFLFGAFLAVGLGLVACGSHRTEIGDLNLTTSPEPPQITVGGEAVVKVVPDQVVLQLGVDTGDKTVESATRKNNEAIKAIQTAALAHGVEAANLQSDYLSIDPRYDDTYLHQNLVGAVAHRMVTITLKDISRYDELLSAVVEVGANTIHGVSFQTTKLRKHRDEARKLALEAAREKAIAMAGTLGRKAGAPLAIEEEQINSWSSYYWRGMGYGGGQSQNVMTQAGPPDSTPEGTLAPGQISVSARVRVKFRLTE